MEKVMDRKMGLSGGSIKILALLLMVLDHIYYFLTPIGLNIPIWFTWLGRIVAPLFVYMTVEGYTYTKNKKRYLSRLYIAYVVMAVMNGIIPKMFPIQQELPIINSMFGSLFLVVLYLGFVDKIKMGIKDRNIKSILLGIVCLILPVVLNFVLMALFFGENPNIIAIKLIMTFIPLPFFVEGGINYVIMAILFYLFRKNKYMQVIVYILTCIPYITSTGFNIHSMLYEHYQWMMVFSSVFILLYNGEKGPGFKWLFYIFYPAHIYIIYILAWFIQTKGL